MKAPKPESTYEPIKPGSYMARCYSIIELGTLPGSNPTYSPSKKILISWELPTVFSEYEDKDGRKIKKVRTIATSYGFTMGKRGNLRKMLEAWTGKPFPSDDAAYDFDIDKMLSRTCLISVINTEKDGEVYSNIATVSPMLEGSVCPDQVNSTFFLCYEKWDQAAFDTLSEKMKAKMASTPEYLKVPRAGSADAPQGNAMAPATNMVEAGGEEIDVNDLPW
jgi:hypothetical protein